MRECDPFRDNLIEGELVRVNDQDIYFVIDIYLPRNVNVFTVKGKLVKRATIVIVVAVELIEVLLS